MSGLQVLSTKKLHHAFADQLEKAGIHLTEKEFIRIDPGVGSEEIKKFIESITNDEFVIFTSSNAVDAIADHAANANWNIFCISGKTKETVLQKFIFAKVIAMADSGVDLAKKIIEHEAKEVAFFSGDIRREELPMMLQQAGIKLRELVVYTTVATPVELKKNFNAVLFFSPSAVKSFFSINQLSANAVCFAIGNTTAEEIKQFTHSKVVVAEKPTQESLVSAVNQFYKKQVQP